MRFLLSAPGAVIIEGMTNSLADLLADKDFDEPPEMRAIKKFVQENYSDTVEVLLRERDIVVTCRSAALANTLRLNINQLRSAAGTVKRIILRIR
jgi:hypothetical protein